MDEVLRQKITDKLTTFLNRAPSESEIINGQTDSTLMQWIAQDDAAAQNDLIASIAESAGLNVETLKAKSLQVSNKDML